MMRRYLFGILLIFPCLLTAHPYPFHALDLPWEGSKGSVNTIVQDHQGFLWLGTWSGLMRYDGYEIKTFSHQGHLGTGLMSNKITVVFEDSRNRLWVGTRNGGLHVLDRDSETLTPIPIKGQAGFWSTWSLTEDAFGRIWIGSEQGLAVWEADTKTAIAIPVHALAQGLKASQFIYSMAFDAEGTLWLGTESGLVEVQMDDRGMPHKFIRHTLAPSPDNMEEEELEAHNYVYRVKWFPQFPDQLWIGTKEGLKRWTKTSGAIFHIQSDPGNHATLRNPYVSDILYSELDGGIWIATYGGLHRWDCQTQQMDWLDLRQGLASGQGNNTLHALFEDRTGMLWAGTEKGVYGCDFRAKPFGKHIFKHPDTKGNTMVTTLTDDPAHGCFWTGFRGGGVMCVPYDSATIDPEHQLHIPLSDWTGNSAADFVSDIEIGPSGEVWVSTHGAGVVKFQPHSKSPRRFEQFDPSNPDFPLGDTHVMSLGAGKDGSIWMGHWSGGLSRFDSEGGQLVNYQDLKLDQVSIRDFPNIALLEMPWQGSDALFVGTRGGGLWHLKWEAGTLSVVDRWFRAEEISSRFITCLFQDRRGNFWIGTEHGLNRMDAETGKLKIFSETDGLPHGTIQAIQEDELGQLWISTKKGICRAQDLPTGFSVKSFTQEDGLQDQIFNFNASTQLGSGMLVFGGPIGINAFHPSQIAENPIPPKVALTALRLFNKPVEIGQSSFGKVLLDKSMLQAPELRLNHRQDVLAIGFTALQFSQSSQTQFAYKLEGFDEDWQYVDATQRMAHYTNLPYRNYIFQVKAANGDGVWSEEIASMGIRVEPPFWLTHWAFVLYFLAFLASLYGVRRFTLIRANLQNRLEMARLETEKLEEVNRMKLQFFTQVSHELRTPLTLILTPLEQLIRNHEGKRRDRESLLRIRKNGQRLLTLINQLLDLRKSEAGLMQLEVAEGNLVKFVQEVVISFQGWAEDRDITLNLKHDVDRIPVWFDRDQMEKVLFNLLSNAIKFTQPGGTITVRVSTETGRAVVQVKDTGVGIAAHQLPLIFDHFFQGRNSDAQQGSGVGLTLAKRIIQQHSGEIWVDSQMGMGTTFQFYLPLGPNHLAQAEKLTAFKGSEDPSQYPKSAEEPTAAPEVSAPADLPVVCVVEDNADIRQLLADTLSEHYEVMTAEDGEQAFEMILQNPPDLVVSDIAMPRRDGLALCREIKSRMETCHIPVILLTARTSLLYQMEGYETGADDYVTKPFHMELLLTRIRGLLAIRARLKEKFARKLELNPSEVAVTSLDEIFLRDLGKIVEDNMDEPHFSVELLCKEIGMSRMQVYRKVKALTGQTPNQLIRNIRLKRAAQLLQSLQFTVAEVTYQVGFSDLKYFRERFKQEFGMSPSEYMGKFRA
ncbi:two-component regulator propeller domain-containing protein [Pontibacter sp. G13]|uniref:two-component regulator propeller domain-containing protein n=1 Tax=Pontibacter sp. G13 TaxID=3074898 RepID=UPI00288C5969|nr:two-component regulator propeller domain-containing protein [Pontibacter sp. G13]WNJ21073.1 two-component regulator propeller domain-containing protein [Pontibacter sp. G13]